MYTSILKTLTLGALFAACASAVPSPQVGTGDIENLGHDIIPRQSDINSRDDFLGLDDLLESRTLHSRQSDINCKGSAFCERLGGSCDDALRKVIPSNTYSTYDGYVPSPSPITLPLCFVATG